MDNDLFEEDVARLLSGLEVLVVEARRLNTGPNRGRELSLTVTKIEEAILWVIAKQSGGVAVDQESQV